MSDLAATNCGCGNECGNRSFGCGSNLLFILLILCLYGNHDDDCDSCFGNFGNDRCGCLIWIIILSCICGNGCF